MDPQLLSTKQVVALTGGTIAEGTLRYWRHKGIGPKSFRLGDRKVVYRKDDVIAWLTSQYDSAGDAA